MMNRVVVLLLGAAGIVAAQAPPPKYDPASVERGKQTFVSTCGFCHGSSAKGGEKGPDLLRSVIVLHDEHGEGIGQVVLNGRVDKGMPRFTLTAAQITDIANFLHNAVMLAKDRDNYQILNIVAGDPKAGAAYFKANCESCHSASGDLKGIAGKYHAATLQGKFIEPTPNPQDGIKVIVTLPSGESFTGVPMALDDFNVSLKDDKGDYHSFRRVKDVPKVEIKNKLQAHLDLVQRYSDDDIHNLTAYLVTLK
jgi:mono/diheme cytochrome c family protein